MNKSVPLFLFLFPFLLSAQTGDYGAFGQKIDASTLRGKKFTLTAAVKVISGDNSASAQIWARVDRTSKKEGELRNMLNDPIRSKEWQLYSISGKIDKDADSMYIGGAYNKKGDFYFDAFRLMVEGEKGKYKEVNLHYPGFETDSAKFYWRFPVNPAFMVGINTGDTYEGQHSFVVHSVTSVSEPGYGSNPKQGSYVKVNGITMYYEEYGRGAPLVLLHGNSESISSFEKQIPELSQHFRVIAIDSRAQGKSSEDGKKFTYELFAEDTKALIDHLHLDKVNILGWSDGGNIGLILAMKYPGKVKSLAVMGANVYNNNSSVKDWVNKELKSQLNDLKKDESKYGELRKRMIDLLLHEPNINAADLGKITSPVLVMAGSDDVIREEHTKLIAESIKNSQLLIFPDGNHFEPAERPARFNKTVIEFFKSKAEL